MKPELKITNRSRYDDIEVERLVKFAFDTVHDVWPVGQARLKVRVTDCIDHWRGRAYVHGHGTFYDGAHVIIRIGRPSLFKTPARISYDFKWKDMPVMYLNSYREALVYIAAHEFAHSAGKSGRKDGEMRCEFAGQDAVDQYRKQQAEIDGVIAERIQRRDNRQNETERRRTGRTAFAKSAAGRLQKAERMLAQWKRRAKLAKTKISRYQRSVAALRKSVARAVSPPTSTPPPAGPPDSPVLPLPEEPVNHPPGPPTVPAAHCAPPHD